MLSWKFIVNPDTDNLEIDEPVGWSDISLAIQRDKKYHGISVTYGENSLRLIGDSAELVKAEYEANGLDGDMQIKIQLYCDDVLQDEETFQFDFGQYNRICGDECTIEIGIEEISCFQTFKNNFEKKADVDSELGFDGVTAVIKPTELVQTVTLNPVETLAIDEWHTDGEADEDLKNQPDWFPNSGTTMDAWLAPKLNQETFSYFGQTNVSSYPALFNGGAPTVPPFDSFPCTVNTTVLLEEITCAITDVVVKFRLKADITQTKSTSTGTTTFATLKLVRSKANTDPSNAGNWLVEYSLALPAMNDDDFDTFDTGDVQLTLTNVVQGDKFYWGVFIQSTPAVNVSNYVWHQYNVSYFRLEALVSCAATTSQAYMIYETLSHVLHQMSNNCLKLESKYFGRKTGTPETYLQDGCGSLRMLTSGLYIRKADKPTFFASMKDLIDNLQCIDSIGFAVEKNNSGDEIMKVEDVREFYQDVEILKLDHVGHAENQTVPSDAIGIIKIGYEKWQAERILGLDEFNSTREWKSSLQAATAILEATCKFISSSYVIEWTRRQSFAKTGGADTKFDNDIFVLCVDDKLKSQFSFVVYGNYIIAPPSDFWVVGHQYTFTGTQFNNNTFTVTAVGNFFIFFILDVTEPVVQEVDVLATAEDITDPKFIVEKGIASNTANVVSPNSMYNWRISPARNLMRLWKLISGAFQNTSTGKLLFSSGTGNFAAEGFIDEPCSPEASTMAENLNLTRTLIKKSSDFLPVIKPETFNFEYPLSVEQYKKLRANPYGYISVQCGNSDTFEKYHVMKVSFKIAKGIAQFNLVPRYDV